MPVFEYQCEKCGKRMEAFQHNRNSLKTCNEVLPGCAENGEIHRLISAFSIKGDSSSADSFLEKSTPSEHTHSGGCGCFGTSSCPSGEVRSKYGIA